MDAALVMVKPDGTSKEVKLDRPSILIGRDDLCKLRIPAKAVSRKHCEVKVEDDELVVKDLGSSNGTYLNGARVKRAELSPGDLLAVGPVVFVVRIDGYPKEIDAKDCFAAGSVASADGDDSGAGMTPPASAKAPVAPAPKQQPTPAAPQAKPAAGAPGKPPAPPLAAVKGSLLDDDDEEDLGEILKSIKFDDDEDDAPPRKK